jgi:hypothetical protein
MRRGVVTAVTLAALAGGAPAEALEPPTGWNGENPFVCELQQAGFAETGPNPAADPYCVEFDKRRQNVAQLGVVEFLSKEPGRVAAASDKCFYFQSDHWRGSIVQDDGTTKTYEWDGHYFFDKARGEGGVWVTNFSFNGRTGDPSALPGMPSEYARYFGPGTGGTITRNDVPADPRCVERARQNPPYRQLGPGARGCLVAKGGLSSRQIGGVALGAPEAVVRNVFGLPFLTKRGFLRWCYQDGTSVRVGQVSDRSGESGAADAETTAMVLTTSAAFRTRRVRPGSSLGALRAAFRGAVRRTSAGGAVVYALARRSRILAGVRRGRVIWLAVHDPSQIRSNGALASWVRRAG